MLEALVKGWDEASKNIEKKAKDASQELSRATIAAGYQLRQAIKTGMQQQAPGGEAWPQAHPWTIYGFIPMAKRAFARRKSNRKRVIKKISISKKGKIPLSRLAAAARYVTQTNGDTTAVRVGFITPSAQKIAAWHAEGPHTVPVTPKMRRFIFAMGLSLSAQSLQIPRRPHVESVYRRSEKVIPDFIDRRVKAALAGESPKNINLGIR
jgi:hypothetical protein